MSMLYELPYVTFPFVSTAQSKVYLVVKYFLKLSLYSLLNRWFHTHLICAWV